MSGDSDIQLAIKEQFARFLTNPSRDTLRDMLRHNVGEAGHLDFKEMWPGDPELARHVLGLANAEGGCIIVGVAERDDGTFDLAGLATLKDEAVVRRATVGFLPAALHSAFNVLSFSYETSDFGTLNGKKFQVVIVNDQPQGLPYIAIRDGSGLNRNRIYVRRGAATEEAMHEELQAIIKRRLGAERRSPTEARLETDLDELATLYSRINRRRGIDMNLAFARLLTEPYPHYPQEGLDAFIARIIEGKKSRIARTLGVSDEQDAVNP